MRRTLKFLHTMGAIGMMGAMACLLVLASRLSPVSALPLYAAERAAMAAICSYVFMPALGATLIAGLLAIAANPVFHNAGWAWAKLATGVLVFEGGLVNIAGPMQEEATHSASALAGQFDPAELALTLTAERNTLWIILAVATANVVLGVWRPRLMRAIA